MHMRIRLSRLLAGLSAVTFALACGDGTGPATARNNPGTGTSTLKVTANIDANDDPLIIGGFSTDYTVSVRDGANSPVSNATVTIKNVNLGTITLPETGTGTGDYALTGSTFPSGDFQLDVVKGTDNVRGVVLGGPGVHNITTPVKDDTLPVNQPLLVNWTVPSRAQSAQIETKNFGPYTLPDTGAYAIPGVNNPAENAQRLRVFRFNEVSIAGALSGSRLRVKVRKTVDPFVVQ